MVKIVDIIFDYMQSHRRLTVPGLGSFLKRGEGEEIFFSEFAKGDDGVLWGEMVSRGVAEVVATAEIEAFVERVRESLDSSKPFFIVGVGALIRKEGEGVSLSRTLAMDNAPVRPEPKPEPKPKVEPKPEPQIEPEQQPIQQPQPQPQPQLKPKPKRSIASDVVKMMGEIEALGRRESRRERDNAAESQERGVVIEEEEEYDESERYDEIVYENERGEMSKPRKIRRIDPLAIFLIVSVIVAIGFFANGFIIGWRIGSITLPAKLDRVMVKVFGDGFDEVEDASQFPIDEVE